MSGQSESSRTAAAPVPSAGQTREAGWGGVFGTEGARSHAAGHRLLAGSPCQHEQEPGS